MRRVKYQQVTVILSGESIARLKAGTPFNEKRVPDHAVEVLRIALFRLFPPKTLENRKDMSRFEGALRHHLLFWYDMICYVLRRWAGGKASLDWYINNHTEQAGELTLRIPMGLMKWVEEISRRRHIAVPEAVAYAIGHAFREIMTENNAGKGQQKQRGWRNILRYVWGRS